MIDEKIIGNDSMLIHVSAGCLNGAPASDGGRG
jgi:hypothetical protein